MQTGWQRKPYFNRNLNWGRKYLIRHPHPPSCLTQQPSPSLQTCFAPKLGWHHSAGGQRRGEGGCRNVLICQRTFYPGVFNLQNISWKCYVTINLNKIPTSIFLASSNPLYDLCRRTAKFSFVSAFKGRRGLNQKFWWRNFNQICWHNKLKFQSGIQARESCTSELIPAPQKLIFQETNFPSNLLPSSSWGFTVVFTPLPSPSFWGLTRGLVSTQWHA